MKEIRIGLLGLGQIGSGVYRALRSKKALLKSRSGVSLELAAIAVKHERKKRAISVNGKLLTTDARRVITDPTIDLIVELIGGIQPAKQFVMGALAAGKDVVTANKALLAEHGDELFAHAKRCGRHIRFEASVGGGIPVIKSLQEGLVSNRVHSILGIINGTSNYVLTKMTQEKKSLRAALKEAQAQGYAEANPRLDIDGIDAAHKLTILASLAFGASVPFQQVYYEGIRTIDIRDVEFAREFGYVIKPLAIAKQDADGIEARVQPTLLPKEHILAKVDGSFNAILFSGDEVGDVLLYGKGAGSRPTASAVISDIVDLVTEPEGSFAPLAYPTHKAQVKNMSSLHSRYYLRFSVIDRPGVLAKIAGVLGKHHVSISDVIQTERKIGNVVPLILLTHHVHEQAIRTALKAITSLAAVRGKSQLLRIEG